MSIRFTAGGTVGELIIDRPEKRNALDEASLAEFAAALDAAEAAGVRALVVRGEGNAFCAGRDLGSVDPANDDPTALLRDRFHPILERLADLPIPTIAAVRGAALGMGLGIALACDVVYVAEDAKVGSPFRTIGAVLDSGGHWFFVSRLGAHRAFELIYSGQLIDGREAERIGLVNRVVPAEAVIDEARAFARSVADGPTDAFRRSKAIVRAIENPGFRATLEREAEAQGAAARTHDFAEGMRAFQEKRRPTFEGR